MYISIYIILSTKCIPLRIYYKNKKAPLTNLKLIMNIQFYRHYILLSLELPECFESGLLFPFCQCETVVLFLSTLTIDSCSQTLIYKFTQQKFLNAYQVLGYLVGKMIKNAILTELMFLGEEKDNKVSIHKSCRLVHGANN